MEISFALRTAIELAQNGNKSSFEFIYKETFSYVWYRANIIMNYNQEITADIVQEAYIICYQRLSTLENIDSFYSWMSSIVYHLGMQYFRKNKHEILLDDYDNSWAESDSIADSHINPELSAEAKVTKEIIKELIETLPETQRMTLLAYYFDGLKIAQIATTMECPESTVKSRLNYAKNSLKTAIETMEKTHGYRIHVISFPVMYFAFKEMYEQMLISENCKTGIYQGILLKLNPSSISQNSEIENNSLDNIDKLISSRNYTTSISSALDISRYSTAALGISAVLTATLSDTPDVGIPDTFDVLKTDFTTLITSLKTKFALASAATAIGNNELILFQNVNLPQTPDYAIETILTSSLCDNYNDIIQPTTMVLDSICEVSHKYSCE